MSWTTVAIFVIFGMYPMIFLLLTATVNSMISKRSHALDAWAVVQVCLMLPLCFGYLLALFIE